MSLVLLPSAQDKSVRYDRVLSVFEFGGKNSYNL